MGGSLGNYSGDPPSCDYGRAKKKNGSAREPL